MTGGEPGGGVARIRHVTVDCRDPYALAAFWSALLGFAEDPAYPNDPADPEALIVDPAGHHPGLLFVSVPEAKSGKNRIHLDLQPHEARDLAVERIVELGGTVVDDRRAPDGTGWVVMADPEGNELCVERSAAERGAPEPAATGERVSPAVRQAGERELLLGILDWYRAGVVAKVQGIRQHHAVARPLPSEVSVAGLVKHLAVVEDAWFHVRFAGNPEPDPWAGVDWDADPDWEFRSARHEPVAEQVARYEAACARSRAVVDAHGLDDVGAKPTRLGPFTLRYAVVHLLEETARHLGHLDLLREHLDGTTGE